MISSARRLALALSAAIVLLTGVAAPRAGVTLVRTHDIPAPQAILALGSHEWERLPAVAMLAHDHPGAVVLLTQPVKATGKNCHLCAERPAWLHALGVERNRIVLLPRKVENTYDEALAARDFCQRSGTTRLLVVTSPYHTRRALATFRSVLDGSGAAVGVYAASSTSPADPVHWWSTPYDRWYVRYEWAALGWYALRHHVNPFGIG
jgi:uncharacterized SAM-binding protein YcdF (DUF218 family)